MNISEYTITNKELNVFLRDKNKREFYIGGYTIKHGNIETEHGLIYKGNITDTDTPLLLRINSACYTSDIFGCQRCDCNWQLIQAMEIIHKEGNGMIIYHFHHEGRGAGWTNKLKSYTLMDREGCSTFEAFQRLNLIPDQRTYYPAILILQDLNIKEVNLISNNPDKERFLQENGIKVNQRIPIISKKREWRNYLVSKKEQFGHKIDLSRKEKVEM